MRTVAESLALAEAYSAAPGYDPLGDEGLVIEQPHSISALRYLPLSVRHFEYIRRLEVVHWPK